MTIEYKSTFDAKVYSKKLIEEKAKALRAALEVEAGQIVKRTQSGRNPDGGSFKPYSKGYAAHRAEKNRRVSPPDLTFTGKMLANITSKVEINGSTIIGRIFFSSAREALKARGNQAFRRFFELSKEQIDRIKTALGRP